jgi:hypothetical protein
LKAAAAARGPEEWIIALAHFETNWEMITLRMPPEREYRNIVTVRLTVS